jgi:dUTP pyrophosphatase
MLKVRIVNKSRWPDPFYATDASAGMDLRADIEDPIVLGPLERALVPTGIFIELPVGYEAQIRPRSGLATKHGITVINSPGTVDADFRGELRTSLVNLSNVPFEIVPGERIAQMVVARHERVEWEDVEVLSETERGAGGWGSTGSK